MTESVSAYKNPLVAIKAIDIAEDDLPDKTWESGNPGLDRE